MMEKKHGKEGILGNPNFCGSTFLKRAQRALWGVLGEKSKLDFGGRS
jgi:hypothetical protein